MTRQERINRLGRILCMEPGPKGFWLEQAYIAKGDFGEGQKKWWLMGGIYGDQPLPQTDTSHTESEALDAAEAWLAPEILVDGRDLENLQFDVLDEKYKDASKDMEKKP